jgi:predicted Zn-ribbon and HTH transcriptional regulator
MGTDAQGGQCRKGESMSANPTLAQCQCAKCGYTWVPRTVAPRCCPNCKVRQWDKPKEEVSK